MKSDIKRRALQDPIGAAYRIAELEAKLALAKEALVFYADKHNWLRSRTADVAWSIVPEDCSSVEGHAQFTGGRKAREALEKLK